MKKVFLDNLPRWDEDSRYAGQIKWKESVGHKVKFIYNDIDGEIEILDFDGKFLTLEYKNNKVSISNNNFQYGLLGRVLGVWGKKYKFAIGDTIDRKYGKLQITNQIRMKHGQKTQKGYNYKCLICNNEDNISEINITSGNGCAVCANQKVLKGHNDLWTTNPEVAKLLKNQEIGYSISKGMARKEMFICPNCNKEQMKIIQSVVTHGVACECGDGISYPEKFVTELMNQINVEYRRQEKFIWAKYKRYDFYIPSINCIIETHGLQHYDNKNQFQRTLEEEQQNDKLKEKLAKENGIERYIIIDCRQSELEWIKNNILRSKLNKLFDLSNIDWLKCHEFACKSLVKEVCDLWNEGIKSIQLICKETKISRGIIRRYLRHGASLGWCDYDPKESSNRARSINGRNNKKSVIQLTLDSEFIKEWESMSDVQMSLNIKHISSVCTGKRNHAGGFRWMYKSDYEKYIEQKNNKNIAS